MRKTRKEKILIKLKICSYCTLAREAGSSCLFCPAVAFSSLTLPSHSSDLSENMWTLLQVPVKMGAVYLLNHYRSTNPPCSSGGDQAVMSAITHDSITCKWTFLLCFIMQWLPCGLRKLRVDAWKIKHAFWLTQCDLLSVYYAAENQGSRRSFWWEKDSLSGRVMWLCRFKEELVPGLGRETALPWCLSNICLYLSSLNSSQCWFTVTWRVLGKRLALTSQPGLW